MAEAEKDATLDYVYKEYVRVSEKCDAYAQLSFNDFKMLAAIGVLLAWKPIADSKWVGGDQSNLVVLIGFIAILFIIAIIGARNLMMTSLITYYQKQLCFYEQEIRDKLGHQRAGTFRLAARWENWDRRTHLPLAQRFYILFILPILIFPTTVLALQDPWWYTLIYFAIAGIVLGIYLSARNVLGKGFGGPIDMIDDNRYAVIIQKHKKSFGASVPDLPGCVAVGETKEEVLQLIQEAVEFHIEDLRKDRQPIPKPSSSIEYVEVRAA